MQTATFAVVVEICFLAAQPVPKQFDPAVERAPADAGELQRFAFEQGQMGVSFKIALYARDEATANKAATAAYARIKQLNGIMSDYDPDSELMRLCRLSGPGKPITVSHELLFVLCRALALSQKTDGAFDVTVGPFVKLWRRARRQKRLPSRQRLKDAKSVVGHRFVHLDEKARRVELLKSGMKLDFGGVAKGYAADEAFAVLKQLGITRALIDASGDIVVGDPPPGKAGWRIGIARLTQPDAPPSRFIRLKNGAVATSGDAFQFVEIEGTRYSHIIDPKTGLGLTTRSSVTVIAPDGITADSLASAISVLGLEGVLTLIEEHGKAAAFIVRFKHDKAESFASKRFAGFRAAE